MTTTTKRGEPRKTSPVRLSMDIPPQLHYDIRREALARDVSMTEYITSLVNQDLYSEEDEKDS